MTERVSTTDRAVPVLPADDLRVAKDFYVEKLGFSVLFEATEDGRNGILGLKRGAICLTIDSRMSGHGRDACVSLHVGSADDDDDEWRGKNPFGNTIFVIGPLRA